MEKLFGIPMNDLMANLLVLFGVLTLVAIVIALRNRLIVKMAIRNIPRRRAQTVLIVVGLMLATTLFSAAFAMGDTMTHSFRLLAVDRLGQVDVIVAGEQRDASGRQIYFDESFFDKIRDHLSTDLDVVEGVAPLSRETVPVLAPETSLSESHVQVLAYDEAWMDKFDKLLNEDGGTLSLSALGPQQVYIAAKTAKKLDVRKGDPIQIFAGPDPTNLQVAGIIAKGANPAGDLAIAMPLSRFHALTGTEGRISNVIITNLGDSIEGDNHTDAVIDSLKPLLEGTDLKAWPNKQDALERADEVGAEFSTVFLVFGQFSVAAGILLIFLIFVMLAAERKRELGIARAVGAQRGHVIRLFAYEGVVYALIAAAVGSMLGVVVGLGMVFIIGAALAGEDFDVVFLFNWRSVIIAYTLGMVLTFAVVAFSSWRVSRLNIDSLVTRAV